MRTRLSSILDLALPVAAASAALAAIGIVVALFWLVGSFSAGPPTAAAPPAAPVQRPEAAAPAVPVERPRPAAAAHKASRAAPPVAAAPPTAPAPAAATGSNSDAAKNRAIGQALSRLGNDPQMQRALGVPSK